MLHEPVRHYVEEMPAPVGDLRRQRLGEVFLAAPLKHTKLFFFLPIKPRGRDLGAIGQSNDALQAEINPKGRGVRFSVSGNSAGC
jgi:hypothetical protein